MFPVVRPEAYAQSIATGLRLEFLEGGSSGDDCHGVLCSSSFMRIVYNVLRHAAQAAVRPSAATRSTFEDKQSFVAKLEFSVEGKGL
jgi:hypothetical protein